MNAQSGAPRRVFEFGPFRLDMDERLLRRQDQPVQLTPKAVELLGVLVSAGGRVVAKEALFGAVWPGVFIEENTLSKHISMLRKALGRGYIETISRRGYRLAAPIRASAAPVASVESSRPSAVAVLPLRNVRGDPELDYLCDGLTEQVIDCLCEIPDLRVMARSTVFRYKGADADPRRLKRELSVDAVVFGRLRENDGMLELSAELCDASDGSRIWATQLRRETTGVHEMSAILAAGIAQALRKNSPAKETPGASADSAAYHHYLKGLYHFNKRTPSGVSKAIEEFRRAAAADPELALAYVGLARCYGLLPRPLVGLLSPAEARPAIETATEKALQLDPTLSEAYVERACFKARYDWDWDSAEAEFRQALALNPRSVLAHQVYSSYCTSRGRFSQGQSELDLAFRSDPLSVMLRADQAFLFFFQKRYDEAIAQCLDTLDMDPDSAELHVALGLAYQEKGDPQSALRVLERAIALSPDVTIASALQAYNLGRLGETSKARSVADGLITLSAKRYVSAFDIALARIGAGDEVGFFSWMRRACEERSYALVLLPVFPFVDRFRRDPRFRKMFGGTGLEAGVPAPKATARKG
ncbi:MAG TPA: winged helix-turn-helix domain-containing protein [Thermoanaerobaculia bacterium]|nr:winged helix-turn-helix domain-containing protein [Thermoanaerobaculia bacterium]